MKTQAIARTSNVKKTLPRIGTFASAFLLAAALGFSLPAPRANAASCVAPTPSLGSATTTVSIPAAGDYTVWSRIKAPDTTNNSYFLEVDGTCFVVGDSPSMPPSVWTWVNYKDGSTLVSGSSTSAQSIHLTLTAGSHDLKFVGRESGVALDKVMFVQDATCVPVDLGDNCASTSDNAGPAINLTTPTANQSVTGTLDIAAMAGDNPGGSSIAKVEFYVDTKKIGESMQAPYTFSWDSTKVANGSHVVLAKAFDAAGNTADSSVQVDVQNGGNATGGGTGTGGTGTGTGGTGTGTGSTGTGGDAGGGTGTGTGGTSTGGDAGGSTGTGGNTGGDIQNPTAPTNVKATPSGTNKVTITWKASTDNVGVTSYKVIRDGIEIASVTTPSALTSYVDSMVQPNTTYAYQVIAFDAAGNPSPMSESIQVKTAEATVADTQAPSTPANMQATAAGSKQINLTWRASSDDTGVTGYEVYRTQGSKDGAGTRIATINATSFGDSGLSASTAYTYYVVAKDAAGNRSPESARVTATTSAVSATTGLPSTGPGDDSLGLTGPGGIKGSINLKVSGGRVVVWVNGTKRIFSLDSHGNYNVAGLPHGVYSIKYTLRNYRVSFLWLKVDDGVKSQNVALKQ